MIFKDSICILDKNCTKTIINYLFTKLIRLSKLILIIFVNNSDFKINIISLNL